MCFIHAFIYANTIKCKFTMQSGQINLALNLFSHFKHFKVLLRHNRSIFVKVFTEPSWREEKEESKRLKV